MRINSQTLGCKVVAKGGKKQSTVPATGNVNVDHAQAVFNVLGKLDRNLNPAEIQVAKTSDSSLAWIV